MNIEQLSNTKIRIILDNNEIYRFFGGYDIGYDNPFIDIALYNIINESLPNEDYLKNCDELTIELYPQEDGCIIDIIKQNSNNKKIYPSCPCRLDFFDVECMIEAMCLLYTSPHKSTNSALYRTDSGYHAIITATKKQINSIHNFCTAHYSKTAIAYIEEYATPICESDAIEKLGKAFCKNKLNIK